MRGIIAVTGLAVAGSLALADSISLTATDDPAGTSVGPRMGEFSYYDTSASIGADLQLRLFNTVVEEYYVGGTGSTYDGSGVNNNPDSSNGSHKAIDGILSTFARIGGSSSGSGSDNTQGHLTLGFDDGFTFGRGSQLVFTEFGGNDEPFYASIDLGGFTFELSDAAVLAGHGITKTTVSGPGGNYRVFTIDLSNSFFDSLTGSFSTLTILDSNDDTNGLSPDINFAGVVVPLPTSAWAGIGLIGCIATVRKLRHK